MLCASKFDYYLLFNDLVTNCALKVSGEAPQVPVVSTKSGMSTLPRPLQEHF